MKRKATHTPTTKNLVQRKVTKKRVLKKFPINETTSKKFTINSSIKCTKLLSSSTRTIDKPLRHGSQQSPK